VVIIAGTVVTGTGPHGGDQNVQRLDLSITTVARVHGVSELLLLSLTVMVAWMARRTRAPAAVLEAISVLLMVEVGQAFVGYVQYLTGVPELLVGIHVFGAVLVWIAVLRVALIASRAPEPAESGGASTSPLASTRL
jgi:cytochrome c oxidase assembly protein subunit 15